MIHDTSRRALAAALALLACLGAPRLSAAPRPVRVGVLPDATSLPLIVAADRGLFAAEGVAAELSLFTSAVERDAAFQAGAVDCVIADTVAAALAVQGGFEARIATVTDGRYGLVSAPGAERDPRSLKGKSVGLSANTIIQYVVDTALSRAGLAKSEVTRSAVPKIPIRLELLLGGQLPAAGLPEPFLSVALARGCGLMASSEDLGIDAGVVLFTKGFLDARTPEAAAVLKAYWKAAEAINARPDEFRPILVDKAGFPTEIRASFRFPRYRKPGLPSVASVEATLDWMRGAGLLKAPLTAASLLDDRPLRGW